MNEARILILDCQGGDLSKTVVQMLESCTAMMFEVHCAAVQPDKPQVPDDRFQPDILIVLVSSPDLPSEIVKKLKPSRPTLVVIESAEPEDLIKLLELGVDDFITCPLRPIEVLPRIRRLLRTTVSEGSISRGIKAKLGMKQLIGQSSCFLGEIKKIPVFAKCDAGVLILGETGTGKELCARALHYLSPRCSGPFIPVNCGGIPTDLVENELFGHQRGAYTGASTLEVGLIEEAEGGTLFLDEIDCLSVSAQVKLLRFLQEKEYRSLGNRKLKKADVRILTASNTDLKEAIASGAFRQDLYYRLSVLFLTLPPLRQRQTDIPLLARHFLAGYSAEFHKTLEDFSPEAMQVLQLYGWPGNVRELEHVVERAVILGGDRIVQKQDIVLSSSESDPGYESFRDAKARTIAAFEKSYIHRLLSLYSGNITKAACAAQKNRRAFFQLLRKHTIDAQAFRSRPT